MTVIITKGSNLNAISRYTSKNYTSVHFRLMEEIRVNKETQKKTI